MTVADTIERFLTGSDLSYQRLDGDRFVTQLRGERKLTIPVGLAIMGEQVVLESFFMRRPEENQGEFYGLLLRRNLRSYGVHFAIDAIGDVFLVGRIPIAAVDEAELDRVFGALLVEADGMFDRAIEIGFESYLATDMAWRAKIAGATEPG